MFSISLKSKVWRERGILDTAIASPPPLIPLVTDGLGQTRLNEMD